jgi:hypothetical protein
MPIKWSNIYLNYIDFIFQKCDKNRKQEVALGQKEKGGLKHLWINFKSIKELQETT